MISCLSGLPRNWLPKVLRPLLRVISVVSSIVTKTALKVVQEIEYTTTSFPRETSDKL